MENFKAVEKKTVYIHPKRFSILLPTIEKDKELTGTDKIIYTFLLNIAKYDPNLTVKVSHTYIAEGTGTDRRTVIRSLKKLEEKDLLRSFKAKKKGDMLMYNVIVPKEPDEDAVRYSFDINEYKALANRFNWDKENK